MLLPLTGNRCPSEDDRVPDPNALVSGSRWWQLTTAALAASRVSGRKYHSAVQASTSYGTPQDSAIADRPMFVASAMITYSRLRLSSAGRATFPPACTR